jgi:hypothetical protein
MAGTVGHVPPSLHARLARRLGRRTRLGVCNSPSHEVAEEETLDALNHCFYAWPTGRKEKERIHLSEKERIYLSDLCGICSCRRKHQQFQQVARMKEMLGTETCMRDLQLYLKDALPDDRAASSPPSDVLTVVPTPTAGHS